MAQNKATLHINAHEQLHGDLNYSRSGTASRTNSIGNIESVASGVIRYDYYSDHYEYQYSTFTRVPPIILLFSTAGPPQVQPTEQSTAVRGKAVTAIPAVAVERRVSGWRAQELVLVSNLSMVESSEPFSARPPSASTVSPSRMSW